MVPLITAHNAETILHSVLEQMTVHNQNMLHTGLLILHRVAMERSELLEYELRTENITELCLWLMKGLMKKYSLGLK